MTRMKLGFATQISYACMPSQELVKSQAWLSFRKNRITWNLRSWMQDLHNLLNRTGGNMQKLGWAGKQWHLEPLAMRVPRVTVTKHRHAGHKLLESSWDTCSDLGTTVLQLLTSLQNWRRRRNYIFCDKTAIYLKKPHMQNINKQRCNREN